MFNNPAVDRPMSSPQGFEGLSSKRSVRSSGQRSSNRPTQNKYGNRAESKSSFDRQIKKGASKSENQTRKLPDESDDFESVLPDGSHIDESSSLDQNFVIGGELSEPYTNANVPALTIAENQKTTGVEQTLTQTVTQSNVDSLSQAFVKFASVDISSGPFVAESQSRPVELESQMQPASSKLPNQNRFSSESVYVVETPTLSLKESSSRPLPLDQLTNNIGRSITNRVSETLIREIPTIEHDGSRSITLKLHPAELGKLTLHVGWEHDSVKAQIVASELATSELLNRDKDQLMDLLLANGFEFASFDVSYGGTGGEQGEQEIGGSSISLGEQKSELVNQVQTPISMNGHGSVVNIIV